MTNLNMTASIAKSNTDSEREVKSESHSQREDVGELLQGTSLLHHNHSNSDSN
jgi:hypothetical protein